MKQTPMLRKHKSKLQWTKSGHTNQNHKGTEEHLPIVILLFVITLCLYADQSLLAPNLTAVGESFGFSPLERDWKLGGQIGFGFFFLGGIASVVVGTLTDRMDRIVLLGGVVLCGAAPSALVVFVRHYWQLFVCRTLTGIAVGGALPLSLSILGDIFPTSQRTFVSSLWGVALGIGGSVGQGLAGYLGSLLGWRVPFLVVAIPTMLFALAFMFYSNDPQRGGSEDAYLSSCQEVEVAGDSSVTSSCTSLTDEKNKSLSCSKIKNIFGIPTNVLGFMQGIPGCVPWGVLLLYFTDYLAQNKHLGVQGATTVSVLLNFGGIFGGLLGGTFGQYLYNRKRWLQPILMGTSTALGAIPLLAISVMDLTKQPVFVIYGLAMLGGGLASMTGCNIRAVMLNVNSPESRGTVFGIFALTDDIGKGMGPVLIAALIAAFGRYYAILVGFSAWFICAVLLAMMAITVERDEDMVQDRLRKVSGLSPITNLQPVAAATITPGLHIPVPVDTGMRDNNGKPI